jgi:hypothetical protein
VPSGLGRRPMRHQPGTAELSAATKANGRYGGHRKYAFNPLKIHFHPNSPKRYIRSPSSSVLDLRFIPALLPLLRLSHRLCNVATVQHAGPSKPCADVNGRGPAVNLNNRCYLKKSRSLYAGHANEYADSRIYIQTYGKYIIRLFI